MEEKDENFDAVSALTNGVFKGNRTDDDELLSDMLDRLFETAIEMDVELKDLLPYVSDGIENLSEKVSPDILYDDAFYSGKIPEAWRSVIDDLADKLKEIKFKDSDPDSMHIPVHCTEVYANELGLNAIIAYAYKGQEHPYVMVDSNYMYHDFTSHKCLTIDIYDYAKYPQFADFLIYREMLNFYRDSKWVRDGVYEEKIGEMRLDKLILDKADEELEKRGKTRRSKKKDR